MPTTRDWAPQAVRLGNAAKIPPALILATIEIESSGNPKAQRYEPHLQDRSIGLGQLLYSTARNLGYTGDMGNPDTLSGLFSPETNLTFTVKLLVDLWRKFGDPARVASAYNGGDRPSLGFGTRAAAPVQICVERNDDGSCAAYRRVPIGEFGNQAHVDKFVAAYNRWYAQTADLNQALVDFPTPLMPLEVPELSPLQQAGVTFTSQSPLEPSPVSTNSADPLSPAPVPAKSTMPIAPVAIGAGIAAAIAAAVFALVKFIR